MWPKIGLLGHNVGVSVLHLPDPQGFSSSLKLPDLPPARVAATPRKIRSRDKNNYKNTCTCLSHCPGSGCVSEILS